jgi:hypothetical protein
VHARYQRAAVATEETSSPKNHAKPFQPVEEFTPSKPTRVFWSTPAMSVRAGRLVGVRLVGRTVEVALVKQGNDRIEWVVADTLLSEFQVALWRRTSKFTL